ncbi:TPA: hypothetical protein ACH3X2_003056 [Trebouxia sp. C0005]
MATQSTGPEPKATRYGLRGEVRSLTSAELIAEGTTVAASSAKLWALRHNHMQPPLLTALFEKLADDLPELSATLALDLTDNYVGTLSQEQFARVFRAMKQRNLQRLLVRFGYEVFIPSLTGALHDLGCDFWLNTRVIVYSPFVSPTLEATLEETLDQITQLNIKTQRRLDYLEDKYDRPSEALKTVNEYVSADTLALEPVVAEAVFELLQGAKEIVHRSYYQFAAKHRSDVHGVVVHELNGKRYVVLSAAKHSVTAQLNSAKSELITAKNRWEEPCELSAESEDLNASDRQDFQALRIADFRDYSIIFAVGGTTFPPNGLTRQ